ncbi:protein phosphatase 1L-like [Panonychus citri]|uniref:protein phosphatase 1L-like n=1 Tax=Panonychus citri TaxID=50023 RepID=UPI0023078FE4|nr:protein phosphatase 1L-like [Panonychus citri]
MESEDYEDGEPFFYTFNSHFKLLLRFLVGLSINWTSFKCLLNSIKMILMRTETIILLISLAIIYICCHSSDVWPNILSKRIPNQWLLKLGIIKVKPKNNCSSSTEGLIVNNVGIYAIQGRRPKMEDTFSYCDETSRFGLQMFGVFDGHGGDSASRLVQDRLFTSILETLENISKETSEPLVSILKDETKPNDKQADEFCPANGDVTCKSTTSPVSSPSSSSSSSFSFSSPSCSPNDGNKGDMRSKYISRLISKHIIDLDKEIVKEMKLKNDVSGTTALVAVNLIKEKTLIVANVGDSRAVLCDRKGNVIPLSFDHKPDQVKEKKRIKDAGGFIQYNGVWRVAGILATSRALGDYPLKDNNLVIPDPDILTFDLNHVKPSFMILASDGLWDTFTNEEAAEFVRINLEMLQKRSWKSSNSIAQELAKSLVHQSYKKGSLDNITVIIVLFDS